MSTEPSTLASRLDRRLVATPGVCGGRARIVETRIRVQDIVVWHERLGLSADEIVTQHPQLELSDVYAALAYYYDHRAEIDEQMKAGEALVEALKERYPSKLKRDAR